MSRPTYDELVEALRGCLAFIPTTVFVRLAREPEVQRAKELLARIDATPGPEEPVFGTGCYSQKTKNAHGRVLEAGMGIAGAGDLIEAMRDLAKHVHCDLTGELREPHFHERSPALSDDGPIETEFARDPDPTIREFFGEALDLLDDMPPGWGTRSGEEWDDRRMRLLFRTGRRSAADLKAVGLVVPKDSPAAPGPEEDRGGV